MCTNESLNNEHDIRIKWVRKFGVCRTSYTSFGKFGTPKTNGRAPKTRFLVKSVQKKYKLSNTNRPPRFTKLNYTVLWVYYTGCTRKTKKKYPSQSSCNPLDATIVSHVHKNTRPLTKFRVAKPTQQISIREQIELHPYQRDFSSPISHLYW